MNRQYFAGDRCHPIGPQPGFQDLWNTTAANADGMHARAAMFHLGGYRLAQNVQTALVALAMLGLLILSVAGFWNAGPPQSPDPQPPRDFGLIAVLGSLLLFVGFDFDAADNSQAADRSHAPATMSAALFASAIVLGLWSAVCLAHVQAERLAGMAAFQISGG